jgi:putative ABC transport system permease protein
MLKNYFRTSFRYLQNHRIFTTINLIGLAIGMSVSFFALLYVQLELSYDTFHEKADRIYRVVTDIKTSTGIDYKGTSPPMAAGIQSAYPEVEAATHLALDYYLVQKDKKETSASEVHVAYADPSLFSVFSFPFVQGDPTSSLSAPLTIVISQSLAAKYFGEEDPVGNSLLFDGKYTMLITGIMKDIPVNSHIQADILISLATLYSWDPSMTDRWNGKFIFHSYVLLPEGYDPGRLSSKLPDFVSAHMDQSRAKYKLLLEPLKSIYLHGRARSYRSGSIVTGNVNSVYIFGIVASFVLFIACFNFINLTTAFSLQRAKEVGVRKIVGATRIQLIAQFLSDAVLLSLFAIVGSFFLCVMLLPMFNQLCGKTISMNIFDQVPFVGLLVALGILIGLISGIFPALFLSGFKTMASLKGNVISNNVMSSLRKGLVVIQFTISIVLIVATIVVYRQLDHMKNQPLGFSQEQKLVIDFHFQADGISPVIGQLENIPGVESVSISSAVPGKANHKLPTKIENVDNEMQEFQADTYFTDFNFLDQYEIEIIAGRNFSDKLASDSSYAMILNETAVKSLGFHDPKDAIGKKFIQRGWQGLIVGVVKDFNFHSLHESVQPLTICVSSGWFTFMTVSVASKDIQAVLKSLEQKWGELRPDLAFNYFFVDQSYREQYASEERFGKLFVLFATLAIFISCLGLLGLSAFTIGRRTKEIGIRKVLGSSVAGIVNLLTWDFILLIVIAFVAGVPLAWLTMDRWLESFAYRTEISWWIFIIAGILSVVIAFFTLSFIAIKAATANPTESLRTE